MEKHTEPEKGQLVVMTDEPERIAYWKQKGVLVIAPFHEKNKAADLFVEKPEDFDELTEEYLLRSLHHYKNRVHTLVHEGDLKIEEVSSKYYPFFLRLLYGEDASFDQFEREEDLTGGRKRLAEMELAGEERKRAICETYENCFRKNYMLSEMGPWIIEWMGEPAGMVSLDPSAEGVLLGYELEKRFRHQGIAEKACKEILNYAVTEFGLESCILKTSKQNKPSRSLAERLGFHETKQEKDIIWYQKTWKEK